MVRIEENYTNVYENSQPRYIKDAMPELKNVQIKVDSAVFSREGMAALHGQVQGVFKQIDVDEIMRMREIFPKLRMDLSYDMRDAMQKDMRKASEEIIKAKGYTSLDDTIALHMNAYTRQYETIIKGHADGTRDVYVSDGVDENGKMQYHKVTLEEDLEYLNEAFGQIADGMVLAANSKAILQQNKEVFGGQKAMTVPLANRYGERLADTLKRAASTYAEQREKGNPANAAKLAFDYLNQDKSFSNTMHMLFSVR
ncbi:MAG: hypothetical protein K2N44_01345 [Lachnospiraceae bacterium]|nr:hypothetical protein [Lachnospiraceae bacterium]